MSFHRGGSGGGIIRVSAANSRIDGVISVDGAPGDNATWPAGSGAGGSLILSLGVATGRGTISARGGAGGAFAPGGGGGLIHLSVVSLASALNFSVAGGTGAVAGDPGILVKEFAMAAAPIIVSVPPTTVKAGQTLTYAANASGATPLTWSLTNAPTGATVSAQGLVSWVATGIDSQLFTLKATNSAGADSQTFAVQVLSPPVITSQARTQATVGVPYLYDDDGIASATGSSPLTWSILAAPTGFTLNSVTGAIAWAPTSLGNAAACIRVANSVGEAQQCFSIVVTNVISPQFDAGMVADAGILQVAPTITSAPSTIGFCGAPYHYSGRRTPELSGTGPFVFTIAGLAGSALPEGLTVDAASGELSWVPTKTDVGTHPLSLTVTNAAGRDTQTFSIVVECKDEPKLALGCGCSSGSAGLLVWPALLLLAGFKRRRRVNPAGVRKSQV